MKHLMLLLVLGGCASTQTVLSQEPREVVRSDKSFNDVVFCLANKNNTAPLDQDDGSKVILIKNQYGAVGMAFTVRPDGDGSTVAIRKAITSLGVIHKQCY